jgi:general secretion pathway protein E
MAIQSALTGHLVFSTLHTNDAAGAVTRLLDLGVEPYLAASSLLASLAQRLVRRVCPDCRRPHAPTDDEAATWGLSPTEIEGRTYFHGAGCETCLGTGFLERVGLFELLTVTPPIQEQIHRRAKAADIKAAAMSDGMTTLRSAGLAKARAGVTTLAEVARVTGKDDTARDGSTNE